MLRRLLAFVLCLMLCLPAAFAQEEGTATPAMDMSLMEAAQQGLLDEADIPIENVAPFIPEGEVDKTIFGADDRKVVSSPGKYPYSAIAYLIVKGRCGCNWTGTGFMIGRYSMMTAAHCVVCTQHGKTAGSITMYFGHRSSKDYYYKYNGATTYWYGTNFSNNDGTYGYTSDHMDWDYAYIKLEKPMGDKTGWFGTQARVASELNYDTYEIAGYREGTLKTAKGGATVYNDYILRYTIDTLPGTSGCPVFDSEYYAVGVNVAQSDSHNYARLFTRELMKELRKNGMFD